MCRFFTVKFFCGHTRSACDPCGACQDVDVHEIDEPGNLPPCYEFEIPIDVPEQHCRDCVNDVVSRKPRTARDVPAGQGFVDITSTAPCVPPSPLVSESIETDEIDEIDNITHRNDVYLHKRAKAGYRVPAGTLLSRFPSTAEIQIQLWTNEEFLLRRIKVKKHNILLPQINSLCERYNLYDEAHELAKRKLTGAVLDLIGRPLSPLPDCDLYDDDSSPRTENSVTRNGVINTSTQPLPTIILTPPDPVSAPVKILHRHIAIELLDDARSKVQYVTEETKKEIETLSAFRTGSTSEQERGRTSNHDHLPSSTSPETIVWQKDGPDERLLGRRHSASWAMGLEEDTTENHPPEEKPISNPNAMEGGLLTAGTIEDIFGAPPDSGETEGLTLPRRQVSVYTPEGGRVLSEMKYYLGLPSEPDAKETEYFMFVQRDPDLQSLILAKPGLVSPDFFRMEEFRPDYNEPMDTSWMSLPHGAPNIYGEYFVQLWNILDWNLPRQKRSWTNSAPLRPARPEESFQPLFPAGGVDRTLWGNGLDVVVEETKRVHNPVYSKTVYSKIDPKDRVKYSNVVEYQRALPEIANRRLLPTIIESRREDASDDESCSVDSYHTIDSIDDDDLVMNFGCPLDEDLRDIEEHSLDYKESYMSGAIPISQSIPVRHSLAMPPGPVIVHTTSIPSNSGYSVPTMDLDPDYLASRPQCAPLRPNSPFQPLGTDNLSSLQAVSDKPNERGSNPVSLPTNLPYTVVKSPGRANRRSPEGQEMLVPNQAFNFFNLAMAAAIRNRIIVPPVWHERPRRVIEELCSSNVWQDPDDVTPADQATDEVIDSYANNFIDDKDLSAEKQAQEEMYSASVQSDEMDEIDLGEEPLFHQQDLIDQTESPSPQYDQAGLTEHSSSQYDEMDEILVESSSPVSDL